MNRFYPHPVVAREGWRIIGTLAALTLFAYCCTANGSKLALWLLLATLAGAWTCICRRAASPPLPLATAFKPAAAFWRSCPNARQRQPENGKTRFAPRETCFFMCAHKRQPEKPSA